MTTAPKWIFPACLKWINLTGHPQEFDFNVNQIYSRLRGSEYKIWSQIHSSSEEWKICSSETYNIKFKDTSFRFADKYTDPIFSKSHWGVIDFPADEREFKAMLDEIFKKHEPSIMDAPTRSPLSGGEDTSGEAVKKLVANHPVLPKEEVIPVDFGKAASLMAQDAWKLPVLAALLASQSSWRYAGAGDFFLAKLLNMDKESLKSMKNELIDLYKGDLTLTE